MDQLFGRELMNVSLAAGNAGAFVVMLIYLIPQMRVKGWYLSHANKIALALAVLFCGGAVYRFSAAVLLWATRMDLIGEVGAAFSAAVVGYLITAVGLLCAARLLTKPPGNWSIVSVSAAMVLAPLVVAIWFG